MSIIIPSNSIVSGGFSVDNSCRFDGSSSYMSITPGSNMNLLRWTWSSWIKRGGQAGEQNIFCANNAASDYQNLMINANGEINFLNYVSNNVKGRKGTTRRLRDSSAWYHIVCVWDSANSTANDRMQIYVNGVRETAFGDNDNPDINQVGQLGESGVATLVGTFVGTSAAFWNGYMAEVVLIDGLALTPTSFGEFDEDSGIWKPIDVSGLTFGTNGFYLDFENSGALGADVSGNTNNFTVNNLTAIDQSTDTCTNNFATLNPLDNFFAGSTLAEGNCKVTYLSGSGKYGYNTGTIALTSGKWYHEIKIVQSAGSNYNMFGIEEDVCQSVGHEYLSSSTGYVLNGNNGKIIARGTEVTYGNATAVNDIIGVYIDLDNNKLYFAENGTIMNSGTGQTIAAASATKHGYYFVLGGDYSSGTVGIHEFNFGNPIFTGTDKTDANGYGSFEYDPSAGTFDSASKDFYALCTKNLAEYG